MFKRVIVDEWVISAPVISFVLIGGVFIIATIIALRMSKNKCEHLASLPLEDSEENKSNPLI
jgi:hypothetical protein